MGWYYYPRSKPRAVKGGGIKARNLQGKMANTWWSERWIQTLDSYGWTNRLERGRTYARKGQVIDFKLGGGVVEARVQGSMPRPYVVRIKVKEIAGERWEKIFRVLGSRAAFAAKLLAGEMPLDMESVFQSCKAPLFPARSELKTDCSCPDFANPCKHIVAVYYILAGEFDRDPFMIFKLRGRAKEEVLGELRKSRPAREVLPEPKKEKPPTKSFPSAGFPASREIKISMVPPRVNAAIVKRLGEPSFWREPKDFTKLMEAIYERVTKEAMKLAFE